MKAIIPVAGMGTRLRPHTHTQPKALMHVAGKPILAHILDDLTAVGIDEVILVVGYLAEMVEAYVREHYRLRAHFVRQEEPLGNGHAIYVAREYLNGEPTLIIMGDTIVRADLETVLAAPHSAIGVREVADPRRFGVVEMDGDGFVRRVVEKPAVPPSNLAVVGIYLIRNTPLLRRCLDRLIEEDRRVRGEYWLADALQGMVDAGERMGTFAIDGWYDCGTAEALLQANCALLDRESPPPTEVPGSVILPPSYVHPTATVEGSVIGPHVSIAEGATIIHSVIRDSIVNANARVERVLLEHSLIGENASVEGRLGRINLGDSSAVKLS